MFGKFKSIFKGFKINRNRDMIDNKSILRKWLPIIEGQFNYRNDKINKILCVYSQWFASNEHFNNELMYKFDEIKEKIFQKT